jgi:molecular chaperone DnaK (HSP70)
MSRYVVGIDLGTTNSALAYADTTSDAPEVRSMPVPQVVSPGDVADRPVLPSFLYLPSEKELPPGSLDLPWKKAKGTAPADRVLGTFARDHGGKVPGRLVSSAKSWLSIEAEDRRAPMLPWQAAADVHKLSPLEASAAYLMHLRDAWNATFAGSTAADRLEHQPIILTVPASFDTQARDLTVEAARMAGLENVTLLEEPQAAFYAWLSAQGDAWRNLVLVREAVGEHILLGGDNMDLALAYAVGATLPSGMDGLDPAQRIALTFACRNAKEILFRDPSLKTAPVAILGRGSKVIGGTIKTELSRETLDRVLLDGFFPACAATDQPARGRRVGLTEIGLPYAADPAVTRHLARFLNRQAGSLHAEGSAIHPSAVLFNGGVFQAEPLRLRVQSILTDWAGGAPVATLNSADLDLAVARGAAYYGLVQQGRGVRIRGGVARSYYVGIETSAPAVPGIPTPIKALCVVPMGMEEGTESDVPDAKFGLVVGEPAEFRFLSSTTRRDDPIGTVLDRWPAEDLQELTPLETSLDPDDARPNQTLPVRLHCRVTEVGTLELWCHSLADDRRWKLEYNVRDL